MKKEIQDWLNGSRDVATGLALIKAINEADWKNLSNQFRFTHKDVFVYLLRVFQGQDVNPAKDNTTPQPAQPQAIPAPKFSNNNNAVQEALAKANKLYKEMSNIRAVLFNLCPIKEETFENEGGKVNERKALTQQVMELQYKVDEAYDAVAFARQYGRLPELVVIDIPDDDLYRTITNLRKSISKLNTLPNRSQKQEALLQEKLEKIKILRERYDRLRHS